MKLLFSTPKIQAIQPIRRNAKLYQQREMKLSNSNKECLEIVSQARPRASESNQSHETSTVLGIPL